MNPLVKTDYLRCPETGEPLEWLDEAQLATLREAIQQEKIVSRGGDLVTSLPEAMLVSQPSQLGYSVLEGIPMLIADEAIALCQIKREVQEEDQQDEKEQQEDV